MAQVFQFPDAEEREWREWEQSIKQSALAASWPEQVVIHALPRAREHWLAIFEPVTVELPKQPVPGPLTKSQSRAIQAVIDASAAVVIERLKAERIAAFRRLLLAELALSKLQVSAQP
jgi:hypothetical protein